MEGVVKNKTAHDETLTRLVGWFEDSETATRDARERSERCRDYYDMRQLTKDEKEELKKRGQPPHEGDEIRRKVNLLLGHEINTRTDPKAFPRNYTADVGAAEAATDALRYVWDNADGDENASAVWENMVIEGYGGCEVLYDPDRDEITLQHWSWDRLFYDPHSRKADFSDAMYLGGVVWMDEDRARGKYPNAEKVIETTAATAGRDSDGQTHDDRPKHVAWADGTHGRRKRIRVVQIYYRDKGEWYWCHYTRGGFLMEPRQVAYRDDMGASICPLIMQSAYVNRDNERYGEVLPLLPRQDAINKRHSKLLHLISVRQVVAEQGAVDSVSSARKELARPDGYIEVRPNKRFEISTTADMASGQAQLLQMSKDDMEVSGPNAALAGKQGKEASGRAIALSQQGGLTELGRVRSRFKHFKVRVFRHMWWAIQQFWTGPKWIRITDNEDNIRFVGLNQPTNQTVGDNLLGQMRGEDGIGEEAAMAIAGQPGFNPAQPFTRNSVAQADIDIVIDEGPDQVTLQIEQFEALMAAQQAAQQPMPFDLLIELLPNLQSDMKRRILDKMAQKAQQPNPQAELAMAKGAAEIEKDKASAQKDMATAAKYETEAFGNFLSARVNALDGQSAAGF